MKAIRIYQFGDPTVLKYEEVPDPTLKANECIIDIRAIGVNYTDVQTRKGNSPDLLPLIPGREAAGVVSAIGKEVTEIALGDLVAYCGVTGSYSQRASVPADRLIKLPEEISASLGAASLLQGMTAHYLTRSTYQLKPGDLCLIHAGAGGVGLLLIQMAKALGATVITTVSSTTKAALAENAGADVIINYFTHDFETETKNATHGKGVQVVYDAVGETTFRKSLACLAPLGMLVSYGQASGPVPDVNIASLSARSLFLTRPTLANYTASRRDLLWRAHDVLTWLSAGTLKLTIGLTLPLAKAAEAHSQLESRTTTGKTLLLP